MNAFSVTGLGPNAAASDSLARPASGRSEFEPALCWEAIHSRDRRFDGKFFAGMETRGVYCRSICPVSFGQMANIRWFHSAAAAVESGFRPCRRCRPDTTPGSAAWFGTMAVVSHALKLISRGVLDHRNIEHLAERVGIGPRHLRRLFDQHLGASPLKIARSHRMHAVEDLILETNVPISEIVSRTGFMSIRQFNHSVRTTFGQSPTKLRLLQGRSNTMDRKNGFVCHLPYRAPFDWSFLIEFFKDRATPGVEVVQGDMYRRTIEIGGRAGIIEVWHEVGHARLSMRAIIPGCECLLEVVQRVRRLFDVETGVVRMERTLVQDARLAKLLAQRPGLRVPGAWDSFELAIRALLGQQLTVIDAPTLVRRLVREFGQPIPTPDHSLTHLFPQAGILGEADLSGIWCLD